jgi:nicotinamidase-related amidase
VIRQLIKRRRKWILIDIDTQRDFFIPGGNTCIRNHRRVLTNVRRIMAWARHNNIRIISICEVNTNNNGSNESDRLPNDTNGQKKIRYTLLSSRTSFAADDSTDIPEDILQCYRQIILHKRCIDPFDEPRIERLLSEVRADNFLIIGACAEDAIKATALGLLQRRKKVSVVVDAVGSFDRRNAELALRKMGAKGAKLIETKKLAGVSHLKGAGICHCEMCQERARQTTLKIRAEH